MWEDLKEHRFFVLRNRAPVGWKHHQRLHQHALAAYPTDWSNHTSHSCREDFRLSRLGNQGCWSKCRRLFGWNLFTFLFHDIFHGHDIYTKMEDWTWGVIMLLVHDFFLPWMLSVFFVGLHGIGLFWASEKNIHEATLLGVKWLIHPRKRRWGKVVQLTKTHLKIGPKPKRKRIGFPISKHQFS